MYRQKQVNRPFHSLQKTRDKIGIYRQIKPDFGFIDTLESSSVAIGD